jgi:glycine/D-amino acid oxidase-like deaminating enzyme
MALTADVAIIGGGVTGRASPSIWLQGACAT